MPFRSHPTGPRPHAFGTSWSQPLGRGLTFVSAVLALLASGLLLAGPAAGHGERHAFESTIAGIEPAGTAAGIEVRMLDYDEQVELVNRSGRTVVVRGYEGEPYAKVESEGPVFLNLRSPSRPLSNDRFGRTRPTGREDAAARPEWTRVGDDGRLAWYDRRSHYRRGDIPAAVEDPDERTLIRDYRIPIEIGGASAAIAGSLYWTGRQSFPTAVFLVLLIGTGICGLFGAWALRRMREPGSR